MAALADANIVLYFAAVVSSFSSPFLSGQSLDVYHSSTHDVALVRIYNAGLKCAARGWLKIQDAKIACAPSHNFRRVISSQLFVALNC